MPNVLAFSIILQIAGCKNKIRPLGRILQNYFAGLMKEGKALINWKVS
jgi:hypothetical protein